MELMFALSVIAQLNSYQPVQLQEYVVNDDTKCSAAVSISMQGTKKKQELSDYMVKVLRDQMPRIADGQIDKVIRMSMYLCWRNAQTNLRDVLVWVNREYPDD